MWNSNVMSYPIKMRAVVLVILFLVTLLSSCNAVVKTLNRLGRFTYSVTVTLRNSSSKPASVNGSIIMGNPDDCEYQRARLVLRIPEQISYNKVRDEDNNWVLRFSVNLGGKQGVDFTYIWIIDQGYKGNVVKPDSKYLSSEPRLNMSSPNVISFADSIDAEDIEGILKGIRRNILGFSYGPRVGSVSGLLTRKKGNCEDYAALGTAIFRLKGLKSRIVTGYALWSLNSLKGAMSTVILPDQQLRIGHAWIEVWDDDHWTTVELTPPNFRGTAVHGIVHQYYEPYNYLKITNGYKGEVLDMKCKVYSADSFSYHITKRLIFVPYR